MKLHLLVLTFMICMTFGCRKSDPVLPPGQVTLVLPAKNEACTSGSSITATQSLVVFNWNTSANTDSYDITVKNLLTTELITQSIASNQVVIALALNTPYSWFITSKSTKSAEVSKSETWKFYNSGPGVKAYAPYPADIIAPSMGQIAVATAGKINLSWSGSDVDNDVVSYDVYFGTTTSPSLLRSAITQTSVSDVAVSANTTYYWKVITRDAVGNTSDSGIFRFFVN